MNILACASGFGLGPGGKLSSIIEKTSQLCGKNICWYACGDFIDTAIFKEDIFFKVCWSRNEENIVNFVKENNIKLAIVILDPDIAIILQKNGVDVFFVDSLPFLWTEGDVVPFNVTQYFAQKCVKMSEEATKIINKVENLKWVNPIVANINETELETKYKVVINLGGLHSTVDNGRGYIKLVLIPLIKNLLEKYNAEEIIVTCGSNAKKIIDKVLFEEKIKNINVSTLVQKEFLKLVINCELFITSPGMTTIYETCKYDKNTIILPPQNLSQYHNANFAKKLIKKVQVLNWNRYDLELEYFNKYLYLGEDFVVEIIFKNIDNASKDNQYNKEMYEYIKRVLNTNFKSQKVIEFKEDGAEMIANEIKKYCEI